MVICTIVVVQLSTFGSTVCSLLGRRFHSISHVDVIFLLISSLSARACVIGMANSIVATEQHVI